MHAALRRPPLERDRDCLGHRHVGEEPGILEAATETRGGRARSASRDVMSRPSSTTRPSSAET